MERSLSRLSLLNPGKLKVLLSLGFKGYLAQKNWFRAYETKTSIDENNIPVPWVTYSFIDFIKSRINTTHSIFEYGSGNSTIFYAGKAKSVTSVEHDKSWYETVTNLKLPNAEILFCALKENGEYCRKAVSTNRKYHIIIVDGRDRVNCCKYALQALTEDGVLILDDSERPYYEEAIDFLKQSGFKHIPFSGMAPGTIQSKCTSVFYKTHNCLDI